MKYRLMNILACPICKTFPLQLIVFNEMKKASSIFVVNPCDEYCSYNKSRIDDLKNKDISLDCKDCLQINIVEGILICQNCGRWYPIMDEIPRMLPDELRNKERDKDFLIKNKERIPNETLSKGKPINLSN
ncbi:MAG: Trm112 family protein [Nitrososphaerales archaeon]